MLRRGIPASPASEGIVSAVGSDAAARFEYGFWRAHAPLLLALLALVCASTGTAYFWHSNGQRLPDAPELAVWWGLWLFLGLGNLWMHRGNRPFLRTVLLSDSAVGVEQAGGGVDWLDWSRIQRIDRVRWPDLHLARVASRGGLRLVWPDREILIYESIQGFEELKRRVEQVAAARGLEIAVRKAAPVGRRRGA